MERDLPSLQLRLPKLKQVPASNPSLSVCWEPCRDVKEADQVDDSDEEDTKPM